MCRERFNHGSLVIVWEKRLFVLLVAGAMAACSLITDLSELDADGGVEKPEAGGDAGPDAAACGLRPPGPSDAAAYDGGGLLAFAFRTVSITEAGAYDLDCHATVADADLPCMGAPDDENDGVDDQFRALVPNDAIGSSWTAQMALGAATVLVSVVGLPASPPEDLNGVKVAVLSAAGFAGNACGDASAPQWNGCDSWKRIGAFGGGYVPAYVRGGELVVDLGQGGPAVPLYLGHVVVNLHEAILTAHIAVASGAPDGGSLLTLTGGGRTGRLDETDAIDLALSYKSNAPQCGSAANPGAVRQYVCNHRDLPQSGPGDSTQTCTTMSFSVGFEAVATAPNASGGTADVDAAGCAPYDQPCQ